MTPKTMSDEETPGEEFKRLVREFNEPDTDRAQEEAWHLIADFALEHADAIAQTLTQPSGKVSDEQVERALSAPVNDGMTIRDWMYVPSKEDLSDLGINSEMYGLDVVRVGLMEDFNCLIVRRILEAAQLPARPVVKALDDNQIMEIIKEVAPWKSEAALNDLLAYEKSVPLFPQATYDVPSYRATKFVRAIERRIISALEGEGE